MQTIPFTTNFFADEAHPPRTDALTEDGTADVVIVGAGLVGLSCAYVLREEGLDVAVVERDHVGFASSGRHMGHL
ncbi:MAG: FAD-binding oxidoreductase, partial [Gammaproteobacteria bacterium]|nr:FAD-binding oxidoreductase [Gammaproteobacteria bacterium]